MKKKATRDAIPNICNSSRADLGVGERGLRPSFFAPVNIPRSAPVIVACIMYYVVLCFN